MISLLFFIFLNMSVGLLMGLTPYISRKDIPFGIRLPLNDKTKKIISTQKKSYLYINLSIAVVINLGIFVLGQVNPKVASRFMCKWKVHSIILS